VGAQDDNFTTVSGVGLSDKKEKEGRVGRAVLEKKRGDLIERGGKTETGALLCQGAGENSGKRKRRYTLRSHSRKKRRSSLSRRKKGERRRLAQWERSRRGGEREGIALHLRTKKRGS